MITFFVPGTPQPGGSKRAFYIPKLGRAVITDANKKARPWKDSVAWCASDICKAPLDGPLRVQFDFYMPRPKGHFGSGKNAGRLKPNAPVYHTTKPDTTKLIRSTEDALTGICWRDDSQISLQAGSKLYSEVVGVQITIRSLEEDSAHFQKMRQEAGLPCKTVIEIDR